MNRVEQLLQHKLAERANAGNLRQLSLNKASVDFYSNDYLGLATLGYKTDAYSHSSRYLMSGSTGSRLLSGNSPEAEALEKTIADFHRAQSALLFNSGYDANTGLIPCITDRHTTILCDELCHASILDGIRLSQSSKRYKFRHNNIEDLAKKLKKFQDGTVVVIVESVYSMDGDTAPLGEITTLCNDHNAQLIVDEAHATGVFGEKGEGLVCAMGLEDRVFARVHTFGKALGCHGAAVVGSDLLKQYLINFARPFIYTTALPMHSVCAIYNAYRYLSSAEFNNQSLRELITYFRTKILKAGGSGWLNSESAIQAMIIGDNMRCRSIAGKVQHAGFQVNPILYPTVSKGSERLRICLHTFNTTEQIDGLFEVIAQA